MYRHLLVLVDGSDDGVGAIGHAVELAQSLGARITFLHVPTTPDVRGPREVRAAAPACSADERASELLSKAEAAARAQCVPCAVACVAAAYGLLEAILTAAHEHQCDLICVAPDTITPPAGDIPVLTCPADRQSVAARAIGRLLDAHRAVAVTLHASLGLVRAAVEHEAGLEAAPMRDIMGRLRNVQLGLHRPKEEEWLYATLRKRACAVEAELGELELQHARNEEAVDELLDMVEHESASGGPPARLEQALVAYARFIWEHMGREEGVILQAARRYLTDADWREIDAAWESAASHDSFAAHTSTTSGPDGSRG